MTLGSGWCGRWPERAVRQPEATEGQVDDGSELGQDPEAAGAADLRLHGRVDRLGTAVTGSIRGGLIAAFSAAVFHGIGGHFAEVAAANRAELGSDYAGVLGTGLKAAQFATQIAAHAMAGGVISVMQGGKFGHGFVSAGATKAASPWIGSIGDGARAMAPARVATAALVGGTVSAATGGKFANGAVTAAFQQAWNGERGLSDAEESAYRTYDPSDPDFHGWTVRTPMCDTASQHGCSVDVVFEQGLLHLPAPMPWRDSPIANRTETHLKGFGPIETLVLRERHMIVNVTVHGHKLHPGFVERRVIQAGSMVYIESTGRGVGLGWAAGAQEFASTPLWRTIDVTIRRRLPVWPPSP